MPPESAASPDSLLGERRLVKACAWCDRVWDHQDGWGVAAAAVSALHATHGICGDCARHHFPDVDELE